VEPTYTNLLSKGFVPAVPDPWEARQFKHLYNPADVTPKSKMPRYPFLFEKRKLALGEKKDEQNKIYEGDYEMVPRSEAIAMIRYLESLHAEVPLFEAPLPQPKTNAAPAAASTNAAPEAAATNAPANTNPPAK